MELNFESWMTDLERFATWEEEWIKQNQALAEISDRNHNVIEQLLQSGETIQLELGAGSEQCREGWTTVDMFPGCDLQLDLREPLPFPDESISMIYSSHVLEHFAYPQPMKNLLSECYRVLKKNGIFSVCVPNARIYIEAYLNPEKFESEKYCLYQPAYNYNSPIDYINYIAYMAGHHCHMFDQKNLLAILQNIGYSKVELRDFDPTIDLEARKHESIYAEAKK